MSSNIVKDPYLLLGDLTTEIYYIRENDLKFGNPFSDEYKEVIVKYNKLCEELRLLDESLECGIEMDNTERNLQNVSDAYIQRLQYEKENIDILKEKLKEIRKKKKINKKVEEFIDEYIKFKQEKLLQENFEYASLLLLDILHQENIQILNSVVKKEDIDKFQKNWKNTFNKIFKNYFIIKKC